MTSFSDFFDAPKNNEILKFTEKILKVIRYELHRIIKFKGGEQVYTFLFVFFVFRVH